MQPKRLAYSKKDSLDTWDLATRAGKLLGVRVHRYCLGKSPEEHIPTAVVHGWRDADVYVEDNALRRKTEFCIVHEIGHMLLHSNKGMQPSVFPRISGGAHDREATVFAGYYCLPEEEMCDLEQQTGGSILALSAFVSKKYGYSRYLPPGPMTSGGGNRRKRTRTKKVIRRSLYSSDENA
jgi:hypothetical protein